MRSFIKGRNEFFFIWITFAVFHQRVLRNLRRILHRTLSILRGTYPLGYRSVTPLLIPYITGGKTVSIAGHYDDNLRGIMSDTSERTRGVI